VLSSGAAEFIKRWNSATVNWQNRKMHALSAQSRAHETGAFHLAPEPKGRWMHRREIL
jgi:hypothetical protein